MCAMRNSAKTVPDLSAALLASMLVDGLVGACGCDIKMIRTDIMHSTLAYPATQEDANPKGVATTHPSPL